MNYLASVVVMSSECSKLGPSPPPLGYSRFPRTGQPVLWTLFDAPRCSPPYFVRKCQGGKISHSLWCQSTSKMVIFSFRSFTSSPSNIPSSLPRPSNFLWSSFSPSYHPLNLLLLSGDVLLQSQKHHQIPLTWPDRRDDILEKILTQTPTPHIRVAL